MGFTAHAHAGIQENIDAANRLIADHVEALDPNLPATYQLFTSIEGSLQACEVSYGYYESIGKGRKHEFGEHPSFNGMRAYGSKAEPCVFKQGLLIPRKQLDYDPSGRMAKVIPDFVGSLASFFDREVWEFLLSNPEGVDGVELFSAAHPFGPDGALQSNVTSAALTHGSYTAAKAAMKLLQRENCDFVGAGPTHLFVNPIDERVARELVGADKPLTVNADGLFDVAGPGSNIVGISCCQNVYQGDVTLVITPRIPAGQWLLLDLSNASQLPLFLYRNSEAPNVIEMHDARDVAAKDVYKWLAHMDYMIGAAYWQRAYLGGV